MGGVDTFDQLRSYIKMDMKSLKFLHPMMYFIVESALVNAWVLYKSNRSNAGLPLQYTAVELQKAICLALASEWEDMGCSFRPSNKSPTKDVAQNRQHKARRSISIAMDNGDRYTAPDKHVSYLESFPLLESSTRKRQRRQMLCAQCSQHKTEKWCRKCAAPLCGTECYVHFHTLTLANQNK
jgi:hypothetical protein